MLCACLEWRGEAWNGVSAEASPRGTQPSSLFIFSPEWCPGRRMSDREKIIRSSRAFNSPRGEVGGDGVFFFFFLEGGVLLLSIHWRENWSMQVSDVGFNVHRERERGPSVFEQHRWSMPIGCFESLCRPARLVLPLHVSRYSWHEPTVAWHSPNVELPRLKQWAVFYALVLLLFLCCRHTDH